ncbi:hypothetical protein CLAFUW4_08199 [Fulvia fulva]|nr:uncharacterized protein CLAFUR5_20254 [Fulvia fulva]KAK4628842.1 hypothetical protein CLAFUR4_08204 [Fulvia fulva]KAK4630316.1 hypothetical protein CLAFUR0_08199 [Fulvia fulva]WMI38829.1 hypothetical protein CLAFUR5_20254 [Fulvia fulva]WPV12396.1 hypothetical protein CLAFUW4_08199 [Fulvia fulva]WPV27150.1 hypothetical protein CLAFUW7_08199 [Fulvia fulva]
MTVSAGWSIDTAQPSTTCAVASVPEPNQYA